MIADRFSERWDAVDPWDQRYPHLWVKVEHLGRYLFAANYLKSAGARTIADIASGTGYGARELASDSRQVFAIDGDPELVEMARTGPEPQNLEFHYCILGRQPLTVVFPEHLELDAVVSFETIEHLTDPASALEEFAEFLSLGGTLILSVPNSINEGSDERGLLVNRAHKRSFTISSLTRLLDCAGFEVQEIMGQPVVAEIARNESLLVRRDGIDARVGDEPAMHQPHVLRRLALTAGMPVPRDVERSYSLIAIATRR